MDSSSVDVNAATVRLDLPPPPRRNELETLTMSAFEAGWHGSVDAYANAHVVRRAIASVLKARVLHVARSRLDAFGLVGDPDEVTLAQLAHLHRTHNGTAGQAFELAVSDAIDVGDQSVCDAVRAGVQALGFPHEGPMSMINLGLEKIPAERQDDFWQSVRHMLPDDGVLRTGAIGRPRGMDRTISDLSRSSWSTMRQGPDGKPVSQLGRCDALLTCGSTVIPVSFKINPRHVRPWSDVPLHISGSPGLPTRDRGQTLIAPSVRRLGDGRSAIHVQFAMERWYSAFGTALAVVDDALERIDLPHRRPRAAPRDTLTEVLVRSADKTVADVVAMLCQVPDPVEEFVTGVRAVSDTDTIPVLGHRDLLEQWRTDGELGRIVGGQQHIFGLRDTASLQNIRHVRPPGEGLR